MFVAITFFLDLTEQKKVLKMLSEVREFEELSEELRIGICVVHIPNKMRLDYICCCLNVPNVHFSPFV